jgi:2'-5' RNA ligase
VVLLWSLELGAWKVSPNSMSDAIPPERLRLFIAVTVPEAIRTEMEKAQAELRRALPKARVSWTKPEHFHLTLKFLGNVETGQVEALTGAVRGSCGSFFALQLKAEQIGFFPNARRPRVVWASVRDTGDQLPELQRAVEAATRDFTTGGPEKQFTGHVTLARVKALKRAETEVLARLGEGMAGRFLGEWTTDHIELLRIEISQAGPRHTVLATITLGAKPWGH